MKNGEHKRSLLLPIGLICVAVGLVLPLPLQMLAWMLAPSDHAGVLRLMLGVPLLLLTELLPLLLLAGVVCTIAGVLVNRRNRKAVGRQVAA